MDSNTIKAELAKRDKETRKLKSFITKLTKALVKADVEVPVPNWKTEGDEEKPSDTKSED